ncbi:alpha/beta hydrolase [Tumidithrix elongata RA019]|uniref:Alpha/beta hydrolase n=1 Tax=Tumidithrix elongata BACA0141 TaxID=2716417 RepID=A0AAW9PVH9_9CYAN|nr:alpha/beta hydrolase [Tumidithrix elongata RA019]
MTSLPLKFRSFQASSSKQPDRLLVALHGWGANADDLVSLAPMLRLENYQFIFPEAPFDHPNVPDGKMWYDLQDFEVKAGLSESQTLLTEFLEALPDRMGIPLANTVLMGFSQGGAMTLDIGSRFPLAGLVCLSGYLHGELSASDLPPVMIAHGVQDYVVPITAARSTRDRLLMLDAQVDYQEYDMGHEIRPQVLERIREFVLGLKANV